MIEHVNDYWWVKYWGLAGSDDNCRALRKAYGAKAGVAGPFWTRADAEEYAATTPAKTKLCQSATRPKRKLR